jgi:hypothetical protein
MNDEPTNPPPEASEQPPEPENIATTQPEDPPFPSNELRLSCNAKEWEGEEPPVHAVPAEDSEDSASLPDSSDT